MRKILTFIIPTPDTVMTYIRLFLSMISMSVYAYCILCIGAIAFAINDLDAQQATAADLVGIVQFFTQSPMVIWAAFILGTFAMVLRHTHHYVHSQTARSSGGCTCSKEEIERLKG